MSNGHPQRREGDQVSDSDRQQKKINEKSYIQLGFALTLVGFIIGAIWWAATMQSKMDQVIEEVKGSRVMQAKMGEYETRLKILELQIEQVKATQHKP